MKPMSAILWKKTALLALLALIGWWSGSAWAADAAAGSAVVNDTALSRLIAYLQENFTRADWDYIMRWVNFAILAGLIVKYARVPLINFLKDKRAETASAFQRFEAQKQQAEEKIREGQILLAASKQRLELIQERIVSEGKKRKEDMIREAQQESRLMLSAARTRIGHHIHETAMAIKNELIDAAFQKALDKLPQAITEADQQRLLNQWMDEAGK